MAKKSRKRTAKKRRTSIGATVRKAAKTRKITKTGKKAPSPKPAAKKNVALPSFKALSLNAPDALLAARAPSVEEVDGCVREWLTWLKGRAPGYSNNDPFPDYIDAEELDGRLGNLAQQLKALDPAFNLQKFVNGKALLKELGKKKSISFFIARIYFYALRACSLKA